MAVAALVVSLFAIGIAAFSLIFTFRDDRRATRREGRELETEAAKRRGRPIVTVDAPAGTGGPTSDPVTHSYKVTNEGRRRSSRSSYRSATPRARRCRGRQEERCRSCKVGRPGGSPAYRIRSVIPMEDLDNEVYQGIWEVEPL